MVFFNPLRMIGSSSISSTLYILRILPNLVSIRKSDDHLRIAMQLALDGYAVFLAEIQLDPPVYILYPHALGLTVGQLLRNTGRCRYLSLR